MPISVNPLSSGRTEMPVDDWCILQLLTGWKLNVSINLPIRNSIEIRPAVNLKTIINPKSKCLSNYMPFHRSINKSLIFTILRYLTNALLLQKMCTNKMRQAKQTSQNPGHGTHFPCMHCPSYKPKWNPLCHYCSMRLEKAEALASLNCQKAELVSVEVEGQKENFAQDG